MAVIAGRGGDRGRLPGCRSSAVKSWSAFVSDVEGRLRPVLTAAFGAEQGREAVAEALGYGWEHWDRVQAMDNPAGYLYRVAHNHARKVRNRCRVSLPQAPLAAVPWVEPGLPSALARLSERQRVAVYLADSSPQTRSSTTDPTHRTCTDAYLSSRP